MKSRLVIFLIICIISPLYPQDNKPYSLKVNLNDNIETIILPQINSSEYSGMDTCMTCPQIYGKYREINIDLRKTPTKNKYLNGTIFRLKIHSIGAKAIEISFNDFFIPKEGSLFIYTPKYELIKGPYTYVDSKKEKIYKTTYIQGETAILEYFEPDNTKLYGRSIYISAIIHVFDDTFSNSGTRSGSSLPCQIDVNCPEGDPYRDIIRSGVFISNLIRDDGWVGMCSGALLRNVSLDPIPYILSAEHCIDQGVEDNLDQAVFWFNYQSPTCGGWANPSADYNITGAELRAKRAFNLGFDTDFSLLELYETPPSQYNVYYAGWNRVPFATDDLKGIHHPAGDDKKISFGYSNSIWSVYLKVKWEDGTVEGGSSGSPILSGNNLILGQLRGHFGPDHTCENLGSDYYGILGDSWWSIWGPSKRLKDWLDPDDIGVSSIPGIDRNNCFASIMYLKGNFPSTEYQSDPVIIHTFDQIIASQNYSGLVIQPDGNYVFKAGNSIKLLPGFHAKAGSNFHAKIENCSKQKSKAIRILPPETTIKNKSLLENIKVTDISSGINIYPNPSKDYFTFEFIINKKTNVNLTIYNLMGQVVEKIIDKKDHSIGLHNVIFNLTNLPEGIYIYKFDTDLKSYEGRIIIVK